MQTQTRIYKISIPQVTDIISELHLLYSKECHREFDENVLFKIDDNEKTHYQNRYNQLIIRRFLEFNSVKNNLLQLSSQFNSLNESLQINERLLNQFLKQQLNWELINPYQYILDEEIRTIQSKLEDLNWPHVLIYSTGEKSKIFQIKTNKDKNDLLDYLVDILKPFDDDELIIDYKENIDHNSIRILDSLDLPLELRISEYNNDISERHQSEYLEQFWDIKYKVYYTIPNLKGFIEEENIEDQLNDLSNVEIVNDGIVFTNYSDEDIDGNEIDPTEEEVGLKLRGKCKELYQAILSESYEDELLLRILEVANGDFELTIIDYSFPEKR